jgi:cytochrome c
MIRNFFASAFAALVPFCCTGLAAAQQSGTAAEAKAMFDRAVAAVKADKATALAEFNDKNNKQFHDRDLYVFCYNMSNGKLTADADQAVMGIDIRTLKFKDDPLGKDNTTPIKPHRKVALP